jgi:uncharacterized membrane protein (DUF485 family)
MSNAAPKQQPADGRKSAHDLIESPDFKALVHKRWLVSTVLTVLLFVGYYGYILLVATNKDFVSQTISSGDGAVVNYGILMGIGTLFFAWILTAIYVAWANTAYDPEVQRLKEQLKR